ncbi:hypothetical protein PVAND_007106 [Polypedilum vanderplanki]|uniref:Reverse transcriptase domain-containing protein n=2 Tax=Polypedilum vanderplanki TaxID=319348 RepID=A0A9J6C684_POLVA|nr:hypothetical protein PVAND_007106 [Polypedilum vanderplanki]
MTTKTYEIYNYMKQKQIHIACLQETHLKTNIRIPADPDYKIYRYDRNNGDKGGVAIVIRKDISHQLLNSKQTKIIENIGVKINLINGEKIMIYSCYLPGGSSNQQINEHFIEDIRKLSSSSSYFLIGDFNSKHRNWNCHIANRAGTLLYDESCQRDLFIDHPQAHTHFPGDVNKRPSTLDIILSNGIHQIEDIKLAELVSDHISVKFQICTNARIGTTQRRKQLDFGRADWLKYREIVNFHISQPEYDTQLNTTNEIDSAIENFTKLMIHARNRTVPQIKSNKYKLVLHTEVIELIKKKNKIKRIWLRNRLPQLKTEVNALEYRIKTAINNIRNSNWNHKLSEIKPSNQSVWRTARFLKVGNREMPPLRNRALEAVSNQEKADMIADQFRINHINPLADINTNHVNNINCQVNNFLNTPTNTEILNELSTPTTDEIIDIIKRLPNNKAPGEDQIKNCLIKQLPYKGYLFLTTILTACFALDYFPDAWKKANVIPIHKPGKDATNPASYRPISLLSSLGKILERTMLARIQKHCNESNIIPTFQHGFRAGLSTVHQLKRTISLMRNALDDKKSAGFITLDIEKAFDRIYHNGVLYKMIQGNFNIKLIKLIVSFLKNRSFCVTVCGAKSATHPLINGVPQGAVISPCLYNIYTGDIPFSSTNDYTTTLFADDVAIIKSNRLVKPIIKGLNKASKNLSSYFNKWKINVNGAKTNAMYVTRRRKKQLPIGPLQIFDERVDWSNEIKYLGIVIDKKLTFKAHIEYVIKRANNAIRVLYPLLSRKSKLNTHKQTPYLQVSYSSNLDIWLSSYKRNR